MSHILTVAMSSSSLRPIHNSHHSRASHQVDGSALSNLSSLHRLWISNADFYRNMGFSFLYSLGLMSLGESKQLWLRALPPLQSAYCCCHLLTFMFAGLVLVGVIAPFAYACFISWLQLKEIAVRTVHCLMHFCIFRSTRICDNGISNVCFRAF